MGAKGYLHPKSTRQSPLQHCDTPPSITGSFMGHALNNTIRIIIRHSACRAFYALAARTDHANIATEVKIVEQLNKEA